MASASATDEPSNMDCTICHERFTVPKFLPCGHLLCRNCLVKWLSSGPEAKCPLCRHDIVDAKEQQNKSVDDIVDSFPTDVGMEALVEADGILSKQHECCLCDNVAAVTLCITCDDMLCLPCSQAHKKQRYSKGHRVEELSTLSVEQLAASRPATCVTHTEELSSVYCPTHGASLCLLCATTAHRQCSEMKTQEAMKEEASAVLEDLDTRLAKKRAELDGAISKVDKNLKELDKGREAAQAEIQSLGQRLRAAVTAWEHRLTQETISKCAEAEANVVEEKNTLIESHGMVMTHSRIVERMKGFSTHGSFCGMTSTMKSRVDDLDRNMTVPTSIKTDEVTMTFDQQAVSRIEQELSQLGQICMTSAQDKAQAVSRIEQELSQLGQICMASAQDKAQTAVLHFHCNHGERITLSNNCQTAQKTDLKNGYGIVVSSECMLADMLYEVHIDSISTSWVETRLGVLTISPDTFHLPDTCTASHPNLLGVRNDTVMEFGQWTTELRPKLYKLPEGSRVGLMVDSGRKLHLYVNNHNKGVLATSIPDPCYFVFDLYSRCTKVTALPVRRVN